MISCYACHVATDVLQTVLEPGDVAHVFYHREQKKKPFLQHTAAVLSYAWVDSSNLCHVEEVRHLFIEPDAAARER